jgi:hypothetical protein
MLIWSVQAEDLAQSVERYARAVTERVLPLLAQPPDQHAARMEELAQFLEADGMDGYQIAEVIQDEEAVAAWHALDLSEEMILLASAGLYHSWEKATRRLLGGLARRGLPGPENGEEKHAKLPRLLELVAAAAGLEVCRLQHRQDIEKVSLVAHIAKHGDGPSLDRLLDRHPEMFYPVPEGLDGKPDASMLLITPDAFTSMAEGIARYWRSLPSY